MPPFDQHVTVPEIRALTGLRFVAALGVVVSHFGSLLGLPPTHASVLLGGAAVALFFILSGFVLTLQYGRRFEAREPGAWRRYAHARLARIAPLHWAVLVVTLGVYLATDSAASLGSGGALRRRGCRC